MIGDRWVMTAAHNLVHNGIQVDKDQVIVSGLGLHPIDSINCVLLVWIPFSSLIHFQFCFGFQVRGGHIDVNELINRAAASVASLHVHPGYDNPNHINYDNDIALIRLQNRITFNSTFEHPYLLNRESNLSRESFRSRIDLKKTNRDPLT